MLCTTVLIVAWLWYRLIILCIRLLPRRTSNIRQTFSNWTRVISVKKYQHCAVCSTMFFTPITHNPGFLCSCDSANFSLFAPVWNVNTFYPFREWDFIFDEFYQWRHFRNWIIKYRMNWRCTPLKYLYYYLTISNLDTKWYICLTDFLNILN